MFLNNPLYYYMVDRMGFLRWLLKGEKIERLKVCFYALEIGTIVCSLMDKISTFFALAYYGATERTLIPSYLVNVVGVVPACIIGFLSSIFPMLLIHYGIRRFKWNTIGHYWIYTLIMTVYFATFYKLVESQILGWIQ